MEIRLSKYEYAVYLALAAARRSEDPFTQVGAAAFSEDGRTLGTGCNGWMAGEAPPPFAYLRDDESRAQKGEYIFHAEENLLANIKATERPYLVGLPFPPCARCSKTMAVNGVKEVVFLREYLSKGVVKNGDDYKKMLDFYKIKYFQLSRESIKKLSDVLNKDSELLKSLC
jgi:dCMP deaminase